MRLKFRQQGFTRLELLLVIIIILVLDSISVNSLGIPFKILFGWYNFIFNCLEVVQLNYIAVIIGIIFFLLFVLTVHCFCQWFYQHYRQEKWLLRWTISCVMMLLFIFSISVSSIIIVHQLIWLKRERAVFSTWEISEEVNKLVEPVKNAIIVSYKNNTQTTDIEIWKRNLPGEEVLKQNGFIEKIEVDNKGIISVVFNQYSYSFANKSVQFTPDFEHKKSGKSWYCITDTRAHQFDCSSDIRTRF